MLDLNSLSQASRLSAVLHAGFDKDNIQLTCELPGCGKSLKYKDMLAGKIIIQSEHMGHCRFEHYACCLQHLAQVLLTCTLEHSKEIQNTNVVPIRTNDENTEHFRPMVTPAG